MTEDTRPPGKTTVAPDVLVEIARMAALKVKGVSDMAIIGIHTGGVYLADRVQRLDAAGA